MPADTLAVLRRVAAELFERSWRIQAYLESIEPGDSGEYTQLASTIRSAIAGVEENVIEAFQTVQQLDLFSTDSGLKVVEQALGRFSRWFTQAHELLVYLPREHVMPETFSLLEESFGNAYRSLNPSILLGSLFNALEFDFMQLLELRIPDLQSIMMNTEKRIVLQLAICDRLSPPAWSNLAHEMGHAIDEEHGISRRVADARFGKSSPAVLSIVRNWAAELCADLIATYVLGPAPILALLSLEYCTLIGRPIHVASKTHPATNWRLSLVGEFLKREWPSLDLLGPERELYTVAWQRSFETFVTNLTERDKEKKQDESLLRHVARPLHEGIEGELERLNLPKADLKEKSLQRCIRRLQNGLPIGAQGQSREALRKAIADYETKTSSLPGDRHAGEFVQLVARFKEEPLNVATLLASAFERRRELIFAACGSTLVDFSGERELSNTLLRLDELIVSSVRSASVHRRLDVAP